MFAPTLFGITPDQFWSLFRDLLTVTIGFMFLFLLGLPLKDMPLIKDVAHYEPPKYVLPVFAMGSLFLSAFALGSVLFLNVWRENVDETLFNDSFQVVRNLDMKDRDIVAADVRLLRFHQLTNFSMIVNGYRVFGSDSNCAFKYQCVDKANTDEHDIDKIEKDVAALNDAMDRILKTYGWAQLYGGGGFVSAQYMRERFTLPHEESISHFLVEGDNFIDFHAWNSGAGGGCIFGAALKFRSRSGLEDSYEIQIKPDEGGMPRQSDDLKTSEIFYAGGEAFLSGGQDRLMPYNTYRASHLYRVCERIRIKFTLTKGQANDLSTEPAFASWALSRKKDAFCALLLGAAPYCEHIGGHKFVEDEKQR